MKRKGDLRELFRNKVRLLHQTRRRITKLEKEIVANGEELSEEFDSGSSLGHDSDTSSSDEAPGAPLMHSPSDEPGWHLLQRLCLHRRAPRPRPHRL